MPDVIKRVERALQSAGDSPADLALAAAVNRVLSERGPMTVADLAQHFREILGDGKQPLSDAEIVTRLKVNFEL